MRDPPDPATLLDMAADTLGTVADAPAAGYQRRIALSLIATVARELRNGPADDAAELARLQALFGSSGDLAALNRRLAAQLRDGTLSLTSPGVAAHLWRTTLAKIAIDQPRYDVATRRDDPVAYDPPVT